MNLVPNLRLGTHFGEAPLRADAVFEKWRGYLWQGRFASFIMDEPYLLAPARYVELNPVRAGLVAKPDNCQQFRGQQFRGHNTNIVKIGGVS